MKRSIPLLFLTLWCLISAPVWAGGVIQELRTAPEFCPSSSQTIADYSVTSNQLPEEPQVSMPAIPPPPTAKDFQLPTNKSCTLANPECLQSFHYDMELQATVIHWKAQTHQGQQAVRYKIFRWSTPQKQWLLLAEVSGKIFKYQDRKANSSDTYLYRIVAVYEVKGRKHHWHYPTELVSVPSPHSEPTPAMGLGCSSTPQTPASGLLWLGLLLGLLPLRRLRSSRR